MHDVAHVDLVARARSRTRRYTDEVSGPDENLELIKRILGQGYLELTLKYADAKVGGPAQPAATEVLYNTDFDIVFWSGKTLAYTGSAATSPLYSLTLP